MTICLCGAYCVLDGTGSWSHPVPFYSKNQRQIERKDGINLKAHQALGPGMADGGGAGKERHGVWFSLAARHVGMQDLSSPDQESNRNSCPLK